MTLIEKLLSIALALSLVGNGIFFYYWRKEYLRNEPLTAKVYDFFRWVAVSLLFIIPTSEALLKKGGIDIILISDNTMEIFKQTLIFFVLPHMLYSIKDFIPEATEFLKVLKVKGATSNVIQPSYPLAPMNQTVSDVPNPTQYH
ncbi:MAG: hypothetical protein KA146_00455 [Leptospiraceae bacterium]|nr:hypothetical protein [Leptospiraceae bacterium]